MASHKITVGKLSRKISQTRSAAEFLSVGKVEGYIMEAAGYVRQTVMLECINLSSCNENAAPFRLLFHRWSG